MSLDRRALLEWCRIPGDQLAGHRDLKIPLAIVPDSATMGDVMAGVLADQVAADLAAGKPTRAIVPCGPMSWYAPFTRIVNERGLSLRNLHVFHMDECLDWQGRA